MKNTFKIIFTIFVLAIISSLLFFAFYQPEDDAHNFSIKINKSENPQVKKEKPENILHPMAIESLRDRDYPGGEFVIDRELIDKPNYKQYVVYYLSEGLKIYGLLTIPTTPKPANGYPAVVFVHGYIPPAQYSTINNYASYQDYLARAGFITFKPDLRGHGRSEGEAVGAHYSEKYVVDTLYAISYLKELPEADPDRIGYWGHSNGGEIGLRVVVVSEDVKAASLWAGVVGSYENMFETINDQISFLQDAPDIDLVLENGLPSANPEFWSQLDPYSYLGDISAAMQIQQYYRGRQRTCRAVVGAERCSRRCW